ncbi:hypothetical protein ABZ885_41725, partial [Kitasatospora sp. NPDC047058]
ETGVAEKLESSTDDEVFDGGLAGARYGLAAIPARWTEPLHVPLPGTGGRVLRLADLLGLVERLVG